MNKIIISSEEWLAFPELELPHIKVRVDSGAKTSSLHAYNIYPYQEEGVEWVRFDVHPIQKNRNIVKRCKAKVLDHRMVRSSNGEEEKRIVIKTPITLGEETWDIEVTLTNRDSMGYRMLLGREAMQDRILVDPSSSFKMGDVGDKVAQKAYKKPKTNKRSLKIALLASNPELYSNKRIMEAGIAHGHEMRFINLLHCYMNISGDKADIHARGGESLAGLDAIIPRIRPANTFYGCTVVRQFQSMGILCLNGSEGIADSRDKLRSSQLMASKGIAMPQTGFASSPQDTKDLINMVGGAPLIVKLLEGTQGTGVVLAETNKAAESVINAFKSLRANILVQEFIKESKGTDIRAFVINGKVVGAMQRKAPEGEFRANVHLGATVSSVTLKPDQKKVAIAAAKAMNLMVAGVDLIQSDSGPKVLEVNSSAGLQGIEHATGLDIASLMIETIEQRIGS